MARHQDTTSNNKRKCGQSDISSDNPDTADDNLDFFETCVLFRKTMTSVTDRQEDIIMHYVKPEHIHLPYRDLRAHHIDFDKLVDWVVYGEIIVKTKGREGLPPPKLYHIHFTSNSGTTGYVSFCNRTKGTLRMFFQDIINQYRDHECPAVRFFDDEDDVDESLSDRPGHLDLTWDP